MGGIKYYQLAKGEELPDEFCAVRDIGGEPSEYTFYAPEAENAKLRERLKARELKVVLQESDLDEIVRIACDMYFVISTLEVANDEAVVSKDGVMLDMEHFSKELRELGIEVES